jgi:FtsP/CotA-like multicopper oxidase with cupredoxin domain
MPETAGLRLFRLPFALLLALLLSSTAASAGQLRTYYITAEEVSWNFAPVPKDLMMGMPLDQDQELYVKRTHDRIGSTYELARYIEYTDASFTERKPRPASEAYLGILGPLIHAEVGDTIHVVFKNKVSHPFSMHPHGVFYAKASEGAMGDGAMDPGNVVPPGGTFTYVWEVPERAGSGPNDPSSVVWPYHSHVDPIKDPNSGLVGAIIVTAKGQANPDGTPKGIDHEFVTLFYIFNENESLYLDDNLATLPDHGLKINREDEDFEESNLKHSINGFIFGNLPMPKMKLGDHVRRYLMGLGTETDLHTPHWHGNTVLAYGHRADVVSMLPAATIVADMVPDDPGIWMFHCHVDDHIAAGMTGRYEVDPK